MGSQLVGIMGGFSFVALERNDFLMTLGEINRGDEGVAIGHDLLGGYGGLPLAKKWEGGSGGKSPPKREVCMRKRI